MYSPLHRLLTLTGLLCAIHLPAPAASAETVLRFNGATTIDKLLKPKLGEIEAKHGVKIELVPNGAGRGLEDLVAGRADVAMLGASLPGVAGILNEKTPGMVKLETLREFLIKEEKIVLIIHLGNPVKSITLAQAKDLFTGKVSNWKDVGGTDLPVTIILPQVSEGVRVSMKERLLEGAQFASAARSLQTSPDLNRVVAQLPGSISFLSAPNAANTVKVLPTDQGLTMPLVLVTIGEPKEPVKAVIHTIQALAK